MGQTPEEIDTLKNRVQQLSGAGVHAEYLSSNELQMKEPALAVGKDSGAAFLRNDCQLDAHLTMSYIEKVPMYKCCHLFSRHCLPYSF